MKKMTKRTLSLLLVIAMICTLGVTALAAPASLTIYNSSSESPTTPVGSTSQSVYAGESIQLRAVDDNGSTASVTWTSGSDAVATVGATTGKVTGVTAGNAVITATSTEDTSVTATCNVTVSANEVTSFTVTPTIGTINGSATLQLTAKNTYTSGKTDSQATWVSDNPAVASVSSTSGLVTSHAVGSATITATSASTEPFASGVNNFVAVTITVTDDITTVTVAPVSGTSNSVGTGKTLALKATTSPNATFKSVKWSSSNANVATVTDKGVVTGVAAGNAKITAEYSSTEKGTYDVTVTQATAAPTVSLGTTTTYYALKSGSMQALSVTTSATTPAYQWYSNTSRSNTTGTKISGATKATYTPATTTVGTTYYYCTVTETLNGVTSDPATSGLYTVTVFDEYSGTVSPTSDNVKVGSSTSLKATVYQYSVTTDNTSYDKTPVTSGTVYWEMPSGSGTYLSFQSSSADVSNSTTVTSVKGTATTTLYGRAAHKAITVTVTYTPAGILQDSYDIGTSAITVSGATYSITAGVPVNGDAFAMSDTNSYTENSVVDQITSAISGVKYVEFDTSTRTGTTYGTFTAVNGTDYYITGIASSTHKMLSDLTFTPGSTVGTYTIGFEAFNNSGSLGTGTLTINVKDAASGNVDIYYNTTTSGTVSMSEQDFIDWYQAQHTTNYVLQSVKFNNLPSSGTMYCGSSKVSTGTTYYTANYLTSSSYKALADVSYTASSSVGCYAVGFTCTGKTSSGSSGSVTTSGTMYLCVTKSGVDIVTYNVYSGTDASLAESDFTTVYKSATGTTASSPKFTIRFISAPTMGTMYRNNTQTSSYKITKSQTTNYYVNASTSSKYDVKDIVYVPGTYTSGKDTVVYAAYDSNGTLKYIGNLVFNYGTKNSSISTYSEGYTFKTSDFMKSTDTDPVVTVQFTGTTSGGYLFRDYTHGTGTSVQTTDKFYTTTSAYGTYGITTVTFIPTAGNTSNVTIAFKATTKSGKTATGTITMVCSVRSSALKFSDVGYNWSWAVGAVDYASSWGIVNGMGNGFQPGTTMNRGMLVTVLYRIAGSPAVSGANPFKDVKAGAFYYSAVIWAYQNGIVTGKTPTTFDPNGAVSRQEIAAILWRYAGKPAGSGSLYGYSDASSVSSYATGAMQWAVGTGVISGKGTRLAPKDSGTRAEVTVMLHRYLAK